MFPSDGAAGAAEGLVGGTLWRVGVDGPAPVGVPSDPAMTEG